ncbi:MAG: hypothetical protein JO054_02505 [Actinobacteria bacterium]|nr:hypothetical protein [Actinomycetota bacterium]MBV9253078.1 hypothetical protein [Actinomycetota bacterium]
MSDHEPFDGELNRALDAPVATGDPSEVVTALQRRKQQRHRNRRVMQVATLCAAVAAVAVGLPLALHDGGSGRRTTVAVRPSPTVPSATASDIPDVAAEAPAPETTTTTPPTTMRHVVPAPTTTTTPEPSACSAPAPASLTRYATKVSFPDTTHGWVLGEPPEIVPNEPVPTAIYRTRDGGRTWDVVICSDPQGADIVFPDATHGWVAGWHGLVLATDDGGSTWHKQVLPAFTGPPPDPRGGQPYDFFQVTATDANHVWATGLCTLVGTADGGRHWTVLKEVCAKTYTISAVSFADPLHGMIYISSSTELLVTSDGGRTWSLSPLPDGFFLAAMQLVDATHGWAVGADTILMTNDGGLSWQRQGPQSSQDNFGTVQFVDLDHGWVVGGHPVEQGEAPGLIMATVDGGKHWTYQDVGPSTASRYDASFTDAKHGWAVGTGTLATSDGGATWTEVPTKGFY